MKKIIQLLLLIVVAGLGYGLYHILSAPLKFDEVKTTREVAIVERLKDIRKAQRAYKLVNGKYTSSFDTLIAFVNNDSIEFETKFGSEDDSLAVAQGKVKTEKFKISVLDTIFTKEFKAEEMRMIPFTNNVEFYMTAKMLSLDKESKNVIAVFEANAPFKAYLGDLDQQTVINIIDGAKTVNRYPGMKVGSLTNATNDAGNWE